MMINPLHLCLLAAASLLLVGCGRKVVDTVWWEGEQERLELAQRLTLKEFRMIPRAGDAPKELVEQQRRNRELSATFESLSARRDALEEEIDSMESSRVGMRTDFLRSRREAVTGSRFESFTVWNGRTYREVFVSSVDDAGVTIRHADGAVRLRYEDLNDDQRELFGLDAGLALVATAKERADAVEYERWIDSRLIVIREKEAASERLAAACERASKIRSVTSSDRQVVAASESPLAQPATQFSSRGSRYSNRYNRYRPSYSYRYYNVPVFRNPCVPSITYLNRLPKNGRPNPSNVTRIQFSR